MGLTMCLDVLIVGGGITGLAAAHRLAEAGNTRWSLLERASRLGGKIMTERLDGFVIEGGPDCFLGSKPGGLELCRALGIEDRLTGTSPAYRRMYVRRNGRLHELPPGITGLVPWRLRPLLTTSILSARGRVRAAMELLVPRRRDGAEESIAEFVSRRFGWETYHWLVEPLLSGIYAGDGRKLSLSATFPRLCDIERTHGSLIRGMRAARRRRIPHRTTNGPLEGPGFLTLPGGMGELVAAVEQDLPAHLMRRGIAVERLRPASRGFEATLSDGSEIESRTVILAVPAYVTADLVEPFNPGLARTLHEIPFVSTATVSVSLHVGDVPQLFEGHGFVSPRAAGGPVVACTWTSNKFPHRVPDDNVLIRYFLGRAGDESVVQASDEEIRHVVRAELERLYGITVEPKRWCIYRWPQGIPQYTLGHGNRLARIEAAAAQHPRLLLAGASYHGVGIPDCIVSGRGAADRALAACQQAVT